MKRRGWNAGFTLVELAVVVTVAGVALTATAGAVTSGAKLARTSAELRASSRSARSLTARIRATQFADVVAVFDHPSFEASTTDGGDSTGASTVSVQPVVTGSARWRSLVSRGTGVPVNQACA